MSELTTPTNNTRVRSIITTILILGGFITLLVLHVNTVPEVTIQKYPTGDTIPTQPVVPESPISVTPPQQQNISSAAKQRAIDTSLMILVTDQTGNPVSNGTGFMLSNSIVTNAHVVADAASYPNSYRIFACTTTAIYDYPECNHELTLTGGMPGISTSMQFDENIDLALLNIKSVYHDGIWQSIWDVPANKIFPDSQISAPDFLSRDEVTNVEIGDTLFTVGYPDFGNETAIFAQGQLTEWVWTDIAPLIVSDVGISFGNSGGAVFNSAGELAGIAVACNTDFNGRCINGIIIPAYTLHLWLTLAMDQKLWEWNGRTQYVDSSFDVNQAGRVLCLLRTSATYDPSQSKTSCVCKAGFSQSVPGGDCDRELIMTDEVIDSIKSQFSNLDARDASCKAKHGPFTEVSTLALLGECLCAPGYTLDGMTNMCARMSDQENLGARSTSRDYSDADQKCQSSHGPASYYSALKPEVLPNCACSAGYTLNEDFSYCIQD